MRALFLAPLLLVAALLARGAIEASKPFDPSIAFAGHSEGRGTLHYLFGKDRAYRVENTGTPLADGSFQLDQAIRFEDGKARERRWIIRAADPGRYTFTLSEAAGPGQARVEGPRFSLWYPARRGGIDIQQDLTLEEDGRILNDGRVCLLGIPFGWMHETITPQR